MFSSEATDSDDEYLQTDRNDWGGQTAARLVDPAAPLLFAASD
jgi:hypothetical protein